MLDENEFQRDRANTEVGDNKEFSVAAISTITVYFYTEAGTTSASDTASAKYFNTSQRRHKLVIRPDKTILINKLNGVTLTDPITIVGVTSYTEKFGGSGYVSMEIDTQDTATDIKIRCM